MTAPACSAWHTTRRCPLASGSRAIRSSSRAPSARLSKTARTLPSVSTTRYSTTYRRLARADRSLTLVGWRSDAPLSDVQRGQTVRQDGRTLPRVVASESATRACEHGFVTSQGGAYSQFKRALERRNFLLAWTTTAKLPKVPLADGLALLLLALDQQPWRFEAAAPRWHALLCAEARLTLPEAQLALAALQALAGPSAVGGGQALVAVCSAHGLDDAVGVLDGWLDSHD
jgi:hypothetical protein